MINEIQELLDKYTAWLRDNTTLREIDDWVEITTPYLDRNNDHLQIYAKKANGGYILTDDSYTIEDLRMSGCNIETPKRQDILKLTLNGFGVILNKDSLEVHTSKERFALQKHNLVQAILAVNDIFYLAEPIVKSLFLEDVTLWLDLIEVRYTSKVKFTGKTGYDHCFDFVIPKSKKHPERILQTINRPNRETAQAIAFSWIDTRDVRPPESRAYALLNDSDKDLSANVIDALKSYEVHPILWSKRENVREELAA
jgi:hypothetical protein